jgi:signal transduction histidine kinase
VKLKQIDPRIEVIVITGWGSAESRSEAFRRGAFDFLEKPFTPEQLLEAVRSAMLRRRDLGQKPLQAPLAIEEELEGHVLADTTAAFIHKLVSQVSQMTIFAKRMENGLGGIEGEIGTQLREFRNRLQDSLGSTQYLLQRFRNAVGRHPGLMKPISISKVLLDVRDHLSFTFSKPIELTLPDGPCDIPGDYELLWHLFENLIRNGMEALESCKNGRLIVTADLPAQSQEIVITVADNGPGIAPEVLSRIFNPSYSTKPNGLGIGLHLARRAAHIHGGQLVCTSTPSTGTIFTVSLPLGRESKDSLQ